MTRPMAMLAMAVTMLGGPRVAASQVSPGPLVSTAWVAERLNDPDVVVLHVGPSASYATAHLPGAKAVNLQAIAVQGQAADGSPLSLQMPDTDTLRKGLEGHGITDSSRIIVYTAAPAGTALA